MDDKVVKLFEGRNLVFIATVMKDGSPQLSPVWADCDGEYIFVNTLKVTKTQKCSKRSSCSNFSS